jgi:anti-repressor protein
MNDLKIFKNEEFGNLRTVEIEGAPWFVGKDVASILGYQNLSRDINRHVDEEDKQMIRYQNGTFSDESKIPRRGVVVINESGLYSLILSSKLPSAKRFKHWVTSEVLPTIRKHGAYLTEEKIDEVLSDPDTIIKLATQLKEERQARKRLQADNERMRPKEIFSDAVSASHTDILIGELAKILKGNGIEIGQNRLFAWLRENGYLIRRKDTDYNMPTQKSMENGLFRIKETAITHSDGHVSVSKTPKVTGSGQVYFVNKFLKMKARGEIA